MNPSSGHPQRDTCIEQRHEQAIVKLGTWVASGQTFAIKVIPVGICPDVPAHGRGLEWDEL